jgi:hypothetical protein
MSKNIKRTVDIDPIWSRFTSSGEGHFEALVRLSENYKPDYMKITGVFTPGVFKAALPAHALSRLAKDEKVLDVELHEYVG